MAASELFAARDVSDRTGAAGGLTGARVGQVDVPWARSGLG